MAISNNIISIFPMTVSDQLHLQLRTHLKLDCSKEKRNQ